MKTRVSLISLVALILSLSCVTSFAADLKEWTFMVFLNANNSLDSFGPYNLKEMEKVGSTDDVNIVVQWAGLASGTTKRMLIKKSTNPNQVTSPVIADIGKVDMGNYHNLVDFVAWAAKNYPAKKYFLNIWDHGSGWHAVRLEGGKLTLNNDPGFKISDISYDENTGNAITTKQMGDAMREISRVLGQKIDLYGSDACLMAMAEIASEVKDSVNVYAGSQETEPGEGWPYDKFLAKLVAKPTMDARELGTILSHEYKASYQNGSHGNKQVTFSIMDLRNYSAFATAMADFSKDVLANASKSGTEIMRSAGQTQSFATYDYRDLLHFLTKIEQNKAIAVSAAKIAALRSATANMLVANDTTNMYNFAQGVSIWLPTDVSTYNNYKSSYDGLVFQSETAWGNTLQSLLH